MTLMIPGCLTRSWSESLRDTLGVLVRARSQAGTNDGAGAARATEESGWVRAAKGGDQGGFRKLVDRYRDSSFETALRIVRDREEAEEVAQDAFVRAWRALPTFREEARFSTWLYRIVTRRAIDRAQATQRRRARETSAPPEVIENVAATRSATLSDGALRRLDRILGKLEPVPRAAVTLFYLRDQSIQEISEILEVPHGTVKTHLHRSRAAMRQAWQREERKEGDHGLPRP